MAASVGGRLRPLPARDRRGRFVSGSDRVQEWVEPPPPPSEEKLLREFDRTGSCRFPDPWQPDGWFVIETRPSLKQFPVAMRYEGPLLKEMGGKWQAYSGVIKYNTTEMWGNRFPPGEVAVSPLPHFGDPDDPWQGHWGAASRGTRATRRQLARLYIHLAHSVDLHTKSCGDRIGVTKNY